jgi:hypothetical protein
MTLITKLPLLRAVAVGAILAAAAVSQNCQVGDDGFSTGCCQPVQPNLPQFPPMQMASVWGCINNCTPTQLQAGVSLSAPQGFFCDYAVVTVTATLSSGHTIAGPLLAKYARTWREMSPTGAPFQVWRLLVNGDLSVTGPAIAGAICPVPPCSQPPLNLPVHFEGHIDYACNPTTAAGWSAAFSLSHWIGCISHAPFSTVPLAGAAGHPGTSYHLVGPAPFMFVPVAEPQGPIVGEALRESRLNWVPFNYNCMGEASIPQGSLVTMNQDCICTPALPIVGPYKHQNLNGIVCCNGTVQTFASIPLPGTPLPTGFLARTLGTWAGAGAFPGNRDLTIYLGVLGYTGICPQPAGAFPIQVVVGVGTTGVPGQLFPPAVPSCPVIGIPAVNAFIDLQNVLILPPALGPVPTPGYGSLFASTKVWNINLP